MVFSSPIFLFLFAPIFFIAYFLTVRKYRNLVALIGSVLFYSWGGPAFLSTLLISLLIDWHIVNSMNKEKDKSIRMFYFLSALIMNIGLLLYFKYSNFFVENINSILIDLHIEPIKWAVVLLPIGISFIVFHKISYIIEVFRDEKKPTDKMVDYFLYILFFPMSIAGPIIKYQDISDQIKYREYRFEDIMYGSYRFSIGLFKKVWIADNVAIIADELFKVPPDSLSIGYAWIGVICYAVQIYFDFSGYADMAIGLSRIMGFKVMENFNMPYLSQNISEFWRRWHISLSSWMRNYIYIPLGGNRRSKIRSFFNLWVVFFISGIWHGANWTFVVWGVLHGILIISDKLFWLNFSKKIPKLLNILITFVFVLITWVFFRADSIGHALGYLKSMFNIFSKQSVFLTPTLYTDRSIVLIIIFSLVITFLPALNFYTYLENKSSRLLFSKYFMMPFSIFILLISIIKCVTNSFSPFIYFRF
ncbi:MBOAT family O-acyltransferase [Paenibacillus oryzisoli]|uniref:MBOAT family O-acyltransferase n=1 Tax=Paenibacillus oryzisoli TaxID=1850517 RepID=UPI000AEF8739|nr:MBOAT family O-acyltransferase [Paenibacillus oryzisoli]